MAAPSAPADQALTDDLNRRGLGLGPLTRLAYGGHHPRTHQACIARCAAVPARRYGPTWTFGRAAGWCPASRRQIPALANRHQWHGIRALHALAADGPRSLTDLAQSQAAGVLLSLTGDLATAAAAHLRPHLTGDASTPATWISIHSNGAGHDHDRLLDHLTAASDIALVDNSDRAGLTAATIGTGPTPDGATGNITADPAVMALTVTLLRTCPDLRTAVQVAATIA